jgi:TctA family transporter
MISIIVDVLVQSELNMLTIPLEEKRVLLSHWWLGRNIVSFFLLGHLDRQPSLRDLALAQRMSCLGTKLKNLLFCLELENTTWVRLIRSSNGR